MTAIFRDERFPTSIAEGATGGPEFRTDLVEAGSGDEDRIQRWSKARWRYDVATGIKSLIDAQSLFAFLLAVGVGRAYTFPFKDFADYQVTAGAIGTGDGSATVFQLVKIYTFGSFSYTRKVKLPVTATVKIYDNAVLKTLATHYTLSARGTGGGAVTFLSPPTTGHALTWTGEFDVPVRFDQDYAAGNYFNANGLLRFENIGLVEDRLNT